MKQLKNKKTILFVGLSAFILVFVGSLAYNKDLFSFANLFHLGGDVVEFVETFDSPDNWTPCTTTPKTAIATNKNNSPRYVRMKINEYWRTSDTTTPESDHETSDLPLTWDDNGTEKHYAVINTQNDDKWELKSDGWYYYKTTLGQDESTLSLLESVTFNCEVNTAGEVRYSVDGKSSESIPTEYGGAKYHLYITFQMSAEEWPNDSTHAVDCGSNILYDTIACQTNGIDSNVNFMATIGTTRGDNGFGVNTLEAHANDNYPIYYFRGAVSDNNVLWRGICWQAIRTTSLGGVKLIYNGAANSPGLISSTDGHEIGACEGRSKSGAYAPTNSTFNTSTNSPADVGYMYGERREIKMNTYTSITEFMYARSVNWDDPVYRLNSPSRKYSDKGVKGYTCFNYNNVGCNPVRYLMDYSATAAKSYKIYPYVELSDGETLEQLKSKMFSNSTNSNAKTALEDWFGANLASYENDLEDVPYCNDRTVMAGPLAEDTTTSDRTEFGPSTRSEVGEDARIHPSIDCGTVTDSFTKAASPLAGNGKSRYRTGLITYDEAILGGAVFSLTKSNSYLWRDSSYWTMSPVGAGMNYNTSTKTATFTYSVYAVGGGSATDSRYILPVVSLKAGTRYVAGGNGTEENPYVIEQ